MDCKSYSDVLNKMSNYVYEEFPLRSKNPIAYTLKRGKGRDTGTLKIFLPSKDINEELNHYLFVHEAGHIIFSHSLNTPTTEKILEGRLLEVYEKNIHLFKNKKSFFKTFYSHIFNIAQDFEVNSKLFTSEEFDYLEKLITDYIGKNGRGCWPEDYGFPIGESWRFYLNMIIEDLPTFLKNYKKNEKKKHPKNKKKDEDKKEDQKDKDKEEKNKDQKNEDQKNEDQEDQKDQENENQEEDQKDQENENQENSGNDSDTKDSDDSGNDSDTEDSNDSDGESSDSEGEETSDNDSLDNGDFSDEEYGDSDDDDSFDDDSDDEDEAGDFSDDEDEDDEFEDDESEDDDKSSIDNEESDEGLSEEDIDNISKEVAESSEEELMKKEESQEAEKNTGGSSHTKFSPAKEEYDFSEAIKIIKKETVKPQYFEKRDIIRKTNQLCESIIRPKDIEYELEEKLNFFVILDVSGSISVSFISEVVFNFRKLAKDFGKNSRIIFWNGSLVQDKNIKDDIEYLYGGDTAIYKSFKYFKKNYEKDLKKSILFVISDFEDELDLWHKELQDLKCSKKIGISLNQYYSDYYETEYPKDFDSIYLTHQ